MAINDDNTINTDMLGGRANAQRGASSQKTESESTQSSVSGFDFSFSNGAMFGAPLGRGMGSEYLTKLVDALREDYKSVSKDVTVDVVPIDNTNETALHYSVIAICMRVKNDQRIAFHNLILEATGDKITPLFEQYNNNQVEITRLPSEAANTALVRKVVEKLKNLFPNTELLCCDSEVVPRGFNPEDKSLVHSLAFNVGMACNTGLLIERKDFNDLNLVKAVGDTNLVINIAFQQQQLQDTVGEPVRSDVLINFTAQKRQDQNRQLQQINSGERDLRITEVSAFVDLVWSPVAPVFQNPMWGQQPVMPMANQKYAARTIITNVGSNLSYSPASILLAILSTLSLTENSNWYQSFRPVPVNGNEIDLRDIGALNIEANLNNEPNGIGTRIDTKSATFGLDHLGSLISNTIRSGMLLSMDIPEAGPQTWCLAGHGVASTINSPRAREEIIKAANSLTNGNFGKYFQDGMPLYVDTGNRIHLGHWVDRNGNHRDIRDIDLLAVANLVGERNPNAMRDWSDTFTRLDYPLNYRLALRKKMIYALTNETAEFTGWAQRVTFSEAFLSALVNGAKDTGLNLRINTPLSAADFNNQRGVADFVGGALVTPGRVFNQSGNFMAGQQNPQQNFIYNFNRY